LTVEGFCGPNTLHKTLSTTFFLYFACILPSIALGVLNYKNTGGLIGECCSRASSSSSQLTVYRRWSRDQKLSSKNSRRKGLRRVPTQMICVFSLFSLSRFLPIHCSMRDAALWLVTSRRPCNYLLQSQKINYICRSEGELLSAVDQGKRHRFYISVGRCAFLDDIVWSWLHHRLATEHVGPCFTGLPLVLLSISTAAATSCAMFDDDRRS